MPFMTGAELFEQLRFRFPNTKRVMLTGYADSHAMLDAINQGQVYYFIKKPWDRDLVFSILVRAIESYDLAISNMALTDRLVANDRCATLGRSAARIAHEMGNQLCMLPLLELIEDKYGDHQDLMQMASIARTTHEHLLELVNEVKSFVRFRQEDQIRQPLLLSEMVHELVEFLRFDRSLPMDRLSVQLVADATVQAQQGEPAAGAGEPAQERGPRHPRPLRRPHRPDRLPQRERGGADRGRQRPRHDARGAGADLGDVLYDQGGRRDRAGVGHRQVDRRSPRRPHRLRERTRRRRQVHAHAASRGYPQTRRQQQRLACPDRGARLIRAAATSATGVSGVRAPKRMSLYLQ